MPSDPLSCTYDNVDIIIVMTVLTYPEVDIEREGMVIRKIHYRECTLFCLAYKFALLSTLNPPFISYPTRVAQNSRRATYWISSL